jgi:hypothetical protein
MYCIQHVSDAIMFSYFSTVNNNNVNGINWVAFQFDQMDHLHYRLNFDLNKSRQKFHHSLKEHHKISNTGIPKFRCEML